MHLGTDKWHFHSSQWGIVFWVTNEVSESIQLVSQGVTVHPPLHVGIFHTKYLILFIYIWSCLPDKLKTVPHPFEVLPRCMEKSQITRTRLNWKSEFRFFFFLGHYNTDDVRSTGSNQRRRLLNASAEGPPSDFLGNPRQTLCFVFLIVSNEPP